MDALQGTFFSMMEQLNEKIQNDLQKISTAPSTTPSTVSSITANFAVFQTFVTSTFCNLQQQLELLANQMDQFEMRSRRKILLLHGVQESSGSNTSQDVVKVVADKLKIPGFTVVNISRCHRVGRTSGDKPRPILVKFSDLALRNKIWFAKTGLKDTGITVSEFLTKGRHEAFMCARRHFGIKKCWTRDGFVFIAGDDGTKHRITTITEVNKLIGTLSAAAAVAPEAVSSVTPEARGSVALKVSAAVAARNKRVARR
ncbi:uncharacterized protein LOC131842463 [Achroia grisella]|uniref:uncharacterized protein LOC131842463 n=1 Tax=Achroia grisella TaxID=688607 RepID=UPI0027D26986|nr:uncharacterized protein LOC131842463 [Achroia grisella]